MHSSWKGEIGGTTISHFKKDIGCCVVVEQAMNPSTREAEAGRSLSSRISWLQSEFQDSQGYTGKPYLNNNNNNKHQLHFFSFL